MHAQESTKTTRRLATKPELTRSVDIDYLWFETCWGRLLVV